MMTYKTRCFAALFPAALMLSMTPALAQSAQVTTISVTVEDSAQERINFSGKLRMLSQRIPAAACHLDRGIAMDAAAGLLAGATAEFEQILSALELGDTDLNIIAAETRRKTLVRIHELREKWTPFKAAADATIAGTATDADISFLLNENIGVLQSAQLLVEELVKQYSNPNAATRASLMLIDISGRQRMLTQKMSKETCMIGSDHQTAQVVVDLAGTARIFEASLEALRFGMPTVGVGPPPNPDIAIGLEGVLKDWQRVEPLVDSVISGDTLEAAYHAEKFKALNTTMANMNVVVGMYTNAAKRS